jgi:hypothetical protein
MYVCTVNSTSDYTLWTLYHSYFKGISANIELQLYSMTCCWPYSWDNWDVMMDEWSFLLNSDFFRIAPNGNKGNAKKYLWIWKSLCIFGCYYTMPSSSKLLRLNLWRYYFFLVNCESHLRWVFWIEIISTLTKNGRRGVVVGILAYYARGRGFDSRTVQTVECMNMSVCIGSGYFYVFTKKNVYKYILIRYLESITQTL